MDPMCDIRRSATIGEFVENSCEKGLAVGRTIFQAGEQTGLPIYIITIWQENWKEAGLAVWVASKPMCPVLTPNTIGTSYVVKSCKKMMRVRMLRWLTGLAERIWYKKSRGSHLKGQARTLGRWLLDILHRSDGSSNNKGRRGKHRSLKHNRMCNTWVQGTLFCNQILPWIPHLRRPKSWLDRVALCPRLRKCWRVNLRPAILTYPPHLLRDWIFHLLLPAICPTKSCPAKKPWKNPQIRNIWICRGRKK